MRPGQELISLTIREHALPRGTPCTLGLVHGFWWLCKDGSITQ
ncbi:hypothetical protein HMPREF0742_01717 [Rothia aeria F0184]|uniref:Uncharacterized protein n=1 Tax=Rothia aeria F0184 TaxID=888019 RepID=U7V1Z4_9MICC|nr:hypothetical protein HMPREF0742_01717 [Rothia aeria F0184]